MGGHLSNDPEPFGVAPKRAVVVPRAAPEGGGDSLPVEDRIHALLRRGVCGMVSLTGDAGSGKSVALAHLAAVLPPEAPVRLIDELPAFADLEAIDRISKTHLIVSTLSRYDGESARVGRLVMARWGEDDLIEYLLARHRTQCQSVMLKVTSSAAQLPLGGSPELWRMVFDALAADEGLADVPAALRRCLTPLLSDPKMTAGVVSLRNLRLGKSPEVSGFKLEPLDDASLRLIRHRPVQVVLAAELIVRNLLDGVGWSDLEGKLPHDLIIETARLAAHWPAAVDRLTALVNSNKSRVHPMAVSVLVQIRHDWRPAGSVIPTLSGAYVAGAHWAGVDLHGGALGGVDLERADLCNANLAGASATVSRFAGALLLNAKLDKLCAAGSDLTKAQLTNAQADGALLRDVNFSQADLRGVSLRGADLTNADLSEAILTSANLREALLEQTKLDGADLVGTNFTGAILRHVRLCDTNLSGTCFNGVIFERCDLEGISLPGGAFAGAKLTGCYLTDSAMPGADFHDADLRNTGLADVNWEGADLRNADLRGATFHMGSTRSGLVGSTIPCEGSKTGFYTDDFSDRDFKNPEEIRKANLCRADLRGANVKGVDFYLVDLRGAHYTDQQARYFRQCGAILD